MMGCIRSFRPSLGCGVVQTDHGEALRFSLPGGAADFHGGDIVEFDLGADGLAIRLALRRRWSDLLNEQQRPLVNAFHRTIQIRA